jgi:hypothetical protein
MSALRPKHTGHCAIRSPGNGITGDILSSAQYKRPPTAQWAINFAITLQSILYRDLHLAAADYWVDDESTLLVRLHILSASNG